MDKRITRIVGWIKDYADQAGKDDLVVGVSGGVDSALTSTLCCMTGLKVFAVTMPLKSSEEDEWMARKHQWWLEEKFPERVLSIVIPLGGVFITFGKTMDMPWRGIDLKNSHHADANTKSRLRMTCLYHVAACVGGLVVGTGNKVEDFGVGFFHQVG